MYGYVVNIESHQPLKRLSITELGFDKIVENNIIGTNSQEAIAFRLDPNQPLSDDANDSSFRIISQTTTTMGANPQFLTNSNHLYPDYMNPFDGQQENRAITMTDNPYTSQPVVRPQPNQVAPFQPFNSSNAKLMDPESNNFEVVWHQLSYTLPRFAFKSKGRRNILKNLNGYFQSGSVTAIMGPSGAGKSTLLEIICGRRRLGVEGEVRLRGVKEIRVGFVPQDNYLLELLTVRESLIFASKLIYYKAGKSDHTTNADKLIRRFGLETIAKTKAKRCSGGQRKRLSIALEVLAKPNLLILDEPTTGLDSPSCKHIMNIMQELVSDKSDAVAVVATIHQPSVALFNGFHRAYVLSKMGECVYHGTPQNLVPTLNRVNVFIDSHASPADYIIEVAAGDYGQLPVRKLSLVAQGEEMERLVTAGTMPLSAATKNMKHPFWTHMKLLYIRCQILIYRDPFLTVLRIGAAIFSAIALDILFGREIGKVSGCPPRELELYAIPVNILSKKFETDMNAIMQNVCLLFLGLMIGFLSGLTPTLLNFPKEMHVFYKEYHNGWYSCLSYYIAKVLSDIPLQVITPFIYVLLTYFWSNQPYEVMRFSVLLMIAILLALLAQSIGECCSAIWMNNQNAAVFVGGFVPLPMILFGGFLVKISRMPIYLQPLSWFSFLRFSFEALLISTYGFGRCQYTYEQFLKTVPNATAIEKPLWAQAMPLIMQYIDIKRGKEEREISDEETVERLLRVFGGSLAKGKSIDMHHSLILSFYELEDYMIYISISILVFYVIALKVITYYVLLIKLHATK